MDTYIDNLCDDDYEETCSHEGMPIIKDRWLNPWLYPKPDSALASATAELVATILRVEDRNSLRERKRTKAATDTLTHTAGVITANLAEMALRPSETGELVVFRGKHQRRTRYDNLELHPRSFAQTLDRLQQLGALEQTTGARKAGASTIRPGALLRRLVDRHGVTVDDLWELPGQETVILGHTSRGFDGGSKRVCTQLIDYRDTQETQGIRERMGRLNAFLASADITYSGPWCGPLRRTLYRRFCLPVGSTVTPTFDRGGRLFGGFWQAMEKGQRSGIRIDGEPLVDLDFASMFPRLAYHSLGLEAPQGDLYDLTGLLPGYKRADHRRAVKAAFSALVFGAQCRAPSILAGLPAGTTGKAVKRALYARHPDLVGGPFGTTAGFGLMFQESEILLAALEALMEQSVVALPCHDGLMVAASKAGVARAAMEAASEALSGFAIPVEVEPLPVPQAGQALEEARSASDNM